jgi:hypothetical protein
MQRRVLKRPRHGWARTAAEKADQAATSGLLTCICICWLAAISLSTFGATVVMVEHVLAWFA